MITHLFSEVDLDLGLSYDELWKKIFGLCEDLGFMPSQRADGISIVGPFNIDDSFEGECQIIFKDNHVQKVKFVLHQNGESKEYCLWENGQVPEQLPEMIDWL